MVLFWKKPETSKDPAPLAQNDLLKRMTKSGEELMTITGPEDGSCVCGDWVGAVVSVNGTSEAWPPLLDAIEDGVFHEGCQHRLEAYSPDNRIEAEFCTGLALAAMQERRSINNRNEDLSSQADSRHQCQREFAKLYRAAQSADEIGAIESALSKCEAALDMLHKKNLFDNDQSRVENILEARIRAIIRQRAQTDENA